MPRAKQTMDGNTAAAHVAYAYTDVAAIYPITPSSPKMCIRDRHREGCFAWILPWCEEESCYLGSGCGPASHGKSITAFTIHFVKKL